jgi:hypothetical protein
MLGQSLRNLEHQNLGLDTKAGNPQNLEAQVGEALVVIGSRRPIAASPCQPWLAS